MIISQLTCGFKMLESLKYVWSEMEKTFLINIYVICATCQLIGFKSVSMPVNLFEHLHVIVGYKKKKNK